MAQLHEQKWWNLLNLELINEQQMKVSEVANNSVNEKCGLKF